ncbi:hypothetical protein [Streptomyces mutabilis]|jgi:hypothetical protein|nr:hypothetical protein [Streptomyces sp. DH17]
MNTGDEDENTGDRDENAGDGDIDTGGGMNAAGDRRVYRVTAHED